MSNGKLLESGDPVMFKDDDNSEELKLLKQKADSLNQDIRQISKRNKEHFKALTESLDNDDPYQRFINNFIDSLSDPVIIFHHETGKIEKANKVAKKMFYKLFEKNEEPSFFNIFFKHLSDYDFKILKRKIFSAYENYHADEYTQDYDKYSKCENGSQFYTIKNNGDVFVVDISFSYYENHKGIGHYVANIRDVTDYYKKVNEIESTRDLYLRTIDNLQEGVVIHNGREILEINQTMVNILGYDDKYELIGKDPFSMVSQEQQEEAVENFIDKNEEPYYLNLVRKDGEKLETKISISVLDDHSDENNFRLINIFPINSE